MHDERLLYIVRLGKPQAIAIKTLCLDKVNEKLNKLLRYNVESYIT